LQTIDKSNGSATKSSLLARTGYELNPNIEPDAAAAVAAKS